MEIVKCLWSDLLVELSWFTAEVQHVHSENLVGSNVVRKQLLIDSCTIACRILE